MLIYAAVLCFGLTAAFVSAVSLQVHRRLWHHSDSTWRFVTRFHTGGLSFILIGAVWVQNRSFFPQEALVSCADQPNTQKCGFLLFLLWCFWGSWHLSATSGNTSWSPGSYCSCQVFPFFSSQSDSYCQQVLHISMSTKPDSLTSGLQLMISYYLDYLVSLV